MKLPFAILCLLLAQLSAASAQAEDWKWQVEFGDDPNRVWVRPRADGFRTLEEALASLEEARVVQSIGLYPMARSVSEQMQWELLVFFRRHFPDELEAAAASAGNLHNPQLAPLMAGYARAVRATSYVARLEEILAAHGYRVVDVSFEKFSMSTQLPSPTFSAATWLVLERGPCEPAASC